METEIVVDEEDTTDVGICALRQELYGLSACDECPIQCVVSSDNKVRFTNRFCYYRLAFCKWMQHKTEE